MRNRAKMLFVLLIAVCAVAAMGACSKAPETGEYTGTLTEALDNSIIVSDDNDMQEFQTGGDTTYDLGDEDRLCVDDVLDISYHEESGKKYADRVILREHIEKEETFAGTVTEVSDKAVTVTGKSMTVEFARNGNSQTDGDLSIGDEVEVVYTGDLSEYPYAAKIRMVTENQKPENGKISGVVSEFTKDSILIAIDSANSYRFSIRNGVGISGADKYVRIGDNVTVTYSGDLGKDPEAININIDKKAEEYRNTINGTIKAVTDEYVTLDTGRNAYIFYVDQYTKYTGVKPAKGYKSEITYRGKISNKPIAINIYCVKQTQEPEEAALNESYSEAAPVAGDDQTPDAGTEKAAVTGTQPEPEPKSETKTKPETNNEPETKTEPEAKTEPETKTEPEPEPDQTIQAEGTIKAWSQPEKRCVMDIPDEGELVLEIGAGAETVTEDGEPFEPGEGDAVSIAYTDKDKVLHRVVLIQKYEEQPGPDDPAENDDDIPGDPNASGEDEGQGCGVVPEGEVLIEAEGIIIQGNEEERSFTVNVDDNELELHLDASTEVASGYFPAKGDKVRLLYSKYDMVLKQIDILQKAAPEEGSGE